MKIKHRTELLIAGESVEALIEELSKFIGKGAIVGDVGSYGCSSIDIVVEREETPEEIFEKAARLKRNIEREQKDKEILDALFHGADLTEEQKSMPSRVGSFSELRTETAYEFDQRFLNM